MAIKRLVHGAYCILSLTNSAAGVKFTSSLPLAAEQPATVSGQHIREGKSAPSAERVACTGASSQNTYPWQPKSIQNRDSGRENPRDH